MPDSVRPPAGPWVVAGPAAALSALEPLVAARRSRQPVELRVDGTEAVVRDPARQLPAGTEAVLVVGVRTCSPRLGLPGLFLRDSEDRRVPVGWLPDLGADLANYARAAARVLARSSPAGPMIILGQWEDRFLRVSRRTARWFEPTERGVDAFQWTADRISRPDMIRGLASCGPGVALYFGHGRPRGWAGYHGVRRDHFPVLWPEPIGALVALCCHNASRWRTSLSFAESLAVRGVFAGGIAAVTKTKHEENRRLGPALCEALDPASVRTLAQWVLALPAAMWERSPFRFIGDPATPLAGAEGAGERAARVVAPAPDAPLPPWPELADEPAEPTAP